MTDVPEPASAPVPDAKRLFLMLCGLGLDDEQAYILVQDVDNVAAANLIDRFQSKPDIRTTRLASILDAQDTNPEAFSLAAESRLRMLIWLISAAVAATGVFVRPCR